MSDILLVGGGKMGAAMARGWRAHKVVTVDPVTSPVKSFADIPQGFAPEYVVLAVKPQTLPEMIGDYAVYKDATFVSIVAGKTISFLEKHLGAAAKIIRAMPNTPAAIGKGVTVACANAHARETDLLAATGDVLWVKDETLLDAVTALSGSGPAYVFLLIEALTQAGTSLGLPQELAATLARRTVIGSAALAEADPASAATLRQNVTSPGGTTEAALKVLLPEMQGLFERALAAAAKRAKELSA